MARHLTSILAVAAAALTLGACSESDQSLADAAKAATKVSDIFLNVCFKTKADPERIKHIAALNNWQAPSQMPPIPKPGTVAGAWKLNVGGKEGIVFAATGPDDRPKAPPGRTMQVCGMTFVGAQEAGFTDTVSKAVDLKKIDAPHATTGADPAGMTTLSESGQEDGSFEVVLGQSEGIFPMIMAFALKTDK